jgi:hypothetical protein
MRQGLRRNLYATGHYLLPGAPARGTLCAESFDNSLRIHSGLLRILNVDGKPGHQTSVRPRRNSPMGTSRIMKLALIATATVAATIGLATPAYAAGLDYSFHSPTGNIRCEMYTGDDGNSSQVVCVEDDHTWVAPSRPLACQANDHWGNALILDRQDGAGVVCYQGTPPDPALTAPTLNYGQKHSLGTITCDSEPSGVTCTDSSTGHFFRLSRESYQLG